MDFNEPQSRNEAILQNILGANNVLVAPQSEIESILQAILNDTPYTEEGRSRIARLLIAIKNNGTWNELPTISRNEEILYCILNGSTYTEEPQSRIEELLIEWLNASSQGYEKTVSGNPISITDALAEPAVSLKAKFNPIQDLHGYDHPWPAGGGKNLFKTTATTTTSAGVTFTVNDDGTISVSGTATGYVSLSLGIAKVNSSMGNVSITGIYNAVNIIWSNIAVRDAEDNILYQVTTGSQSVRFTVDLSQYPDADNIIMAVERNSNGEVGGILEPQVEIGTIGTAYAPYSNICPITGWDEVSVFVGETQSEEDATKYSVSFESQGTVYGGYVDVVSGELVVDRAVVDLGMRNWIAGGFAGISGYYAAAPQDIKSVLNSQAFTGIMSEFRAIRFNAISQNFGAIALRDNRILYANYSAEPSGQLVYELAEPLTYQLTPQEVQMLLGSNTVWSDGDEVELTYKGSNPALQLSAMLKKSSNNLKSLKLKK